MNPPPAPLLVLTAVVSVQVGSAVARTLFEDLGAAGMTLLRLAIAAVILGAVFRPRIRGWHAAAWRAAALLGAVMAGMNLLFYLALRTVPLGVGVTVEFLGPLLLALAQTRRLIDLCCALLAGGGVALLGLAPGVTAPVGGLLLAFAAGLCWAGYILASAHLGTQVPGTGGLAVAVGVAALLVLPFGAHGASAVLDRPSLLVGATVVALLSSVLSYGLEINALRRMPTRVFGVLMSLEPAAAAVAGLIVLHQRLGAREIAALLLVSLASLCVTLTRRDPVTPIAPG
ncbi:DMT family transporter [Amorphoplanes digitatis]|uniref:Inner membrane transporter RhtA n=1 Tax=Actinoplanes digitatis TaxID=1868 RepID=A0A7W7HX81_9ACTN|nr:EamA family transporter [Actinoplanes digitatis]MBB4762445.1 inner membrane transporter RhtA [Actinoplanes digitatis]BFE71275.1 DMT family transporter [Actinoplanes digitatis]GID92431.1 threonine transporter RhtB [Actinoplanes digitatis]